MLSNGSQEFQPVIPIAAYEDEPYVLSVSESVVLAALKQLNREKQPDLTVFLIGSCESMQRFLLNPLLLYSTPAIKSKSCPRRGS